MIDSYSSPYNIGHKALDIFWSGKIWIEEKVDGSQISFRKNIDGTLEAKAHKQDLTHFLYNNGEGAGMFCAAARTIIQLAPLLHPNWTYRGEYLQKPHHNTLTYDRVPNNHIILYDVDTGGQHYLSPPNAALEAERIGLEFVPILGQFEDRIELEKVRALLTTVSVLGGQVIEGVVLKNYDVFGTDKKVLMAKMVRRDFVEDNKENWKNNRPSQTSVQFKIIDAYATVPRWKKAIQHLREQGRLVNGPQDIGPLIIEIQEDVKKDAEDEIKKILFNAFWPDISRGLIKQFPLWYKSYILSEQGDDENESTT